MRKRGHCSRRSAVKNCLVSSELVLFSITFESYLTVLGWLWRGHELADSVEDDFELGVVFPFEGGELSGQVFVFGQYPAKLDEGAHNLDVDLDGAGAV